MNSYQILLQIFSSITTYPLKKDHNELLDSKNIKISNEYIEEQVNFNVTQFKL